MADVEFNPDELDMHSLIAWASRLADGLSSNENFPGTPPPLEALHGALQELKVKHEEYRSQRRQLNDLKLERDPSAERLREALLAGVNYVQQASGGDMKKIMSANLPVEHGLDIWPFNNPGQVHELSASGGDGPGEIELMWDPVGGAAGYEIEISHDLGWPEEWAQCGATDKSKTTIDQLISGVRYWFRVRAANEKGIGAWSDPVTKFAP